MWGVCIPLIRWMRRLSHPRSPQAFAGWPCASGKGWAMRGVCIHGSPDRMGKLYLFNASGTGHGLAGLSCMIRGRPRVVSAPDCNSAGTRLPYCRRAVEQQEGRLSAGPPNPFLHCNRTQALFG